jgi:hypothetical protein
MKKMNKTAPTIFTLLIVLVSGCNHAERTVSEEQAASNVIELRSGHIGKVEILSTELKRGNYLIAWKNAENCERGVDSVDGKTGEVEMITASIC